MSVAVTHNKPRKLTLNKKFKLKETVSVILSDPPCKDGNAGFTTVPLKVLSDHV